MFQQLRKWLIKKLSGVDLVPAIEAVGLLDDFRIEVNCATYHNLRLQYNVEHELRVEYVCWYKNDSFGFYYTVRSDYTNSQVWAKHNESMLWFNRLFERMRSDPGYNPGVSVRWLTH